MYLSPAACSPPIALMRFNGGNGLQEADVNSSERYISAPTLGVILLLYPSGTIDFLLPL